MAGPMTMYLLVHDAMRREAGALEVVAAELAPGDHEAAQELAERVLWFETFNGHHEHAEEEVLFPALETLHPLLVETYLYDHEHMGERSFRVMRETLEVLARPGEEPEIETSMALLRRAAVALHEHLSLHIEKENTLLVPRVQHELSVPEQAEIAAGLGAALPPDVMASAVGWMYDGQTLDDREQMLRALLQALPSEIFARTVAALAARDVEQAWAELSGRIPELADF